MNNKDQNQTIAILSRKKITDYILYLSLAILLFGSGYKYAQWQIQTVKTNSNTTVFNTQNNNFKNKDSKAIDFNLFWDTWNKIEQKYVDKSKIDAEKMYYGAIKGMVGALEDQYTFFLTPEENKQSKDDLGGKFQGIGAQLGLKDKRVVVVSPLKDSPAEKAGLKAGDIIEEVDSVSTKNWTLIQAVSKIRGPENTKVKLKILRAAKFFEVSIVRKQILVPSVELSFKKIDNKNIAVIAVTQFGDNTNSLWDKAVKEVLQKKADGIVLDLRNNPGGYLESSVHLASDFIKKGSIVVTQESSETRNYEYKSKRDPKLENTSLVILINEGSASASEILSGALRDYKKAKLVGEKSFGKGSVQEALDLNGGAGLHVTVAKWILPNGSWINGVGITPDFTVINNKDMENTVTEETDLQMKKALELITE